MDLRLLFLPYRLKDEARTANPENSRGGCVGLCVCVCVCACVWKRFLWAERREH